MAARRQATADGDRQREALLSALQDRLGRRFRRPALLETALIHRSALAESPELGACNEALELLGDAVLDLLIAESAVRGRLDADEGRLSRTRAALVNGAALAARARGLGLGPLLRLGRGEARSGGAGKESILAGAFEALAGAVYLDGGVSAARRLVQALFGDDLGRLLKELPEAFDPKSALQERLQHGGAPAPEYQVLESRGPDHRRRFRVAVLHRGRQLAEGEGGSKKAAEVDAARRALAALGVAPPPAGGKG